MLFSIHSRAQCNLERKLFNFFCEGSEGFQSLTHRKGGMLDSKTILIQRDHYAGKVHRRSLML